MYKDIQVLQYDANWPKIFLAEATLIKKELKDNLFDIEHIGSTSIPGMVAKKDIDILCIVSNLSIAPNLELLGYRSKGEYNIPLRQYFSKNTDISKINLHVVEPGHGFIGLNLFFRNYLRKHEDAKTSYSQLKENLLSNPKSYEIAANQFTFYNLGKNSFIKSILAKAGWDGITMNLCTHTEEWAIIQHFRNKYFFIPQKIEDPYKWTFNHSNHKHLVLYLGSEIIGYVHLELLQDLKAAIRIMVIDEAKRNNNYGSHFLMLCESWLRKLGYKSLYAGSNISSLEFYKKNNYAEMLFNWSDDYRSDPENIQMGKILKTVNAK